MRLRYGEAEERFRAELVAWLEEHAPPREVLAAPKRSSADLQPWARAWQRRLFEAGWLVPGWPPELGGRNASPGEQMIYFEEMKRREIPRSLNPQGIGIIAPSLRDAGTPDQQARWLLPTLRADIAWCLGMSEPGAGSDLASLKTRAVLDGDHFVVNGQKVWTSGAHDADWCMCFVRTNVDAPKHQGISVLVIDMRSPGVEARPFAELTEPDYEDFNEVFFTDVIVPAENLLGELDRGWALTQASLAHERAMLWVDYAYDVQRAFRAMVGLAGRPGADGAPLGQDARFRDDVARFYVDSQALLLMGYRGFSKFMRGRAAPEHSLLKLYGSETLQEVLLTATEWQGPTGLDLDVLGPAMWRQGAWVTQYLRSFSGTIPGGTSEIQRNIIAERVLGLPRSGSGR
ncbi:MAG TPA: acyl-CoA dehydrogenase family protein [Acidimicrobiia bacterium]|jgi:alkylation response protein AidB-like acyl-CoA dehydrogenase|nr:acyl-CoA dehydrogenase family protein [Acidimicrobiia bacterium]